jgi:phospholipase C
MESSNHRLGYGILVALAALGAACGAAGGDAADQGGQAQTGGVSPATPIEHVVVIVQENHSFDAYFGNYCTADIGSNPRCHDGPDCCETGPGVEPGKFGPFSANVTPENISDETNVALDRDHTSECEYYEMHCSEAPYGSVDPTAQHADDGGKCKMDRYVDIALLEHNLCGRKGNYAIATPDQVITYFDFAHNGALGDNYFQPIIGQTSSNDMFLARAQFEFKDNGFFPDRAGADCQISALPDKPKKALYQGKTTIADLLIQNDAKRGFGYYHVGYDAARAAGSACAPIVEDDCPVALREAGRIDKAALVPCLYDPSDDPFKYYAQFGDDSAYIHDYKALAADVAAGRLPSVVYVKATTALDEHPGFGTLSRGEQFVQATVDTVMQSPQYKDNTLVLVTWDEGGGYFDHVPPPIAPDGRRYGTRVPILAVGKFVHKDKKGMGYISHVQMEHSSIVKFLEWNFLGKVTGQLGGRDGAVKNIGSLLDPALGVPDGED